MNECFQRRQLDTILRPFRTGDARLHRAQLQLEHLRVIDLSLARNAEQSLGLVVAADRVDLLFGSTGQPQVAARLLVTDGAATTFNVVCANRRVLLGYGDCSSRQAGVWGRPGAVYNQADDSIYIVSSNGPYTGKRGGSNWGNSIVRLPPDLRAHKGKPFRCVHLDKQDLDLGSSALALPSSSTGRRCGDRGGRNRQGSRNLDATRGSRPSERDARRGADLVLPQSLRVWRRARRRGWRTTGLALPSCRWQRLRRARSVAPRCGTHGGRRGHRCIVFSRTATSR